MKRRTFIKTASAGALALTCMPGDNRAKLPAFEIALPELDYARDALEPHISARTLEFHHGKHHQGYVNKTKTFIKDTDYDGLGLAEIIQKSAGDESAADIFNNAAQVFNHSFYWKCMKPGGGGTPSGKAAAAINSAFGGYDQFVEALKAAAASQFGSGWAWLAIDGSELKVVKTGNADTPLAHDMIPLLTIDVWEHAYYLDYQNRRGDYITAFVEHLLNWDFVEKNFA